MTLQRVNFNDTFCSIMVDRRARRNPSVGVDDGLCDANVGPINELSPLDRVQMKQQQLPYGGDGDFEDLALSLMLHEVDCNVAGVAMEHDQKEETNKMSFKRKNFLFVTKGNSFNDVDPQLIRIS